MSNWTRPLLTTKGQMLLAKAESGKQLNFSCIKTGDGTASEVESLTDLVSPKQMLGITTIDITDDNQCVVTTNINNTALTAGYYVREIGLFAEDPDDGQEWLFAYSSDSAPDFMPATGSAAAISLDFSYYIGIGNAENVTATINLEGYATINNVTTLIKQLHTRLLGMKYDEDTEKLTLPKAIGSVTEEKLVLSWEEYEDE